MKLYEKKENLIRENPNLHSWDGIGEVGGEIIKDF